jgi:hypothetical protein
MPPKKKNKNANANARGFATTSIPKAKPVVVEEPEPEPELLEIPAPASPDQAAVDNVTPPENEDAAEDEYVVLADRIENVTLRRVDAFLGQAQKVNVEVLPVLKMESKLEHNVVALLKQAGAKNAGEFLSCDVILSLGEGGLSTVSHGYLTKRSFLSLSSPRLFPAKLELDKGGGSDKDQCHVPYATSPWI